MFYYSICSGPGEKNTRKSWKKRIKIEEVNIIRAMQVAIKAAGDNPFYFYNDQSSSIYHSGCGYCLRCEGEKNND